jgi:2-aminoethylphosphonate-pyruvate transaminase
VYYAFREALNELLEEGVENRIRRYKGYAATIRTRLEEWGVKPVLSPALQGNTLTAFYLPEGCAYQRLHDELKLSGYVIYAGQGQLEEKIFRVANIGALTSQNIEGFLSAFQAIVSRARA